MIKSIYLENFKTHHLSTLDFSIGTNLIIGKIGSGKSSIVDGICYALYGTFPSLSNKKLNTPEIIMFKPSKEEKAKVVLEFVIDFKKYRVEREIDEKKGTSAKLYLENKLIAGPKQTEVTLKVEEILQVPYKLFTKIVYSEQNELDYFLKIPPTKRKETFDDLFGIIKLEDVKVGARELDRFIDSELNTINKLLVQISSQLNSFNYMDLISNKEKSNTKQEELELLLETEISKEKTLAKELESQNQKKKEFEVITNELISKKSKLEDINNYLLKNIVEPNYSSFTIDDLNSQKEKLILDQNNLKLLLIKKEKLIAEKESFENELSRINKLLLDDTKAIELYKLKLEGNPILNLIESKKRIDQELSILNQNRFSCLSSLNELNSAISELKKGFSKCPICDNLLSKEEILINLKKKEDALIFTKQEIEKTNILINKSKQEEDILEKSIIAQKEIELQFKSILQSINRSNERKIKINTELINLGKELATLVVTNDSLQIIEDAIKLNDGAKNIFEKKENKIVLDQEVNNLINSLNKIGYIEEEYIKMRSNFLNIESNITSIKSQLSQNKLLLDNFEAQLNNFILLRKEKDNLDQRAKIFQNKKQDISFFIKSIEISQHQLRKVLIDNINDALDIIWNKIYPYKDYISARIRSEKDYILEVQTKQKEWIRVEGLLSGGERACSAISIRIAIALILTKNLGLLVLDEPTHNLDNKSIELLGKVLDDELPGLINQVFIITHDTKLLETLNSHKFIIERDKENDGVSEILTQ